MSLDGYRGPEASSIVRVPSQTPNGSSALAVFDDKANGGDGNNAKIDPGNKVFDRPVVWVDRNQDASREPSELRSLRALKIGSSLSTAWSRLTSFGNEFRHKARIIDEAGRDHRTVYDVFLKVRG